MAELGKLFVINGALSSGKTSTAKALQNLMTEPSLLLGIDAYHLAIAPNKLDIEHPDPEYFHLETHIENDLQYTKIVHGPVLERVNRARHAANQAFLNQGLNIVADEVFWKLEHLKLYLTHYQKYQVYIFGLRVSEQAGLVREMGRGQSNQESGNFSEDSRPLGLNRESERIIHQWMDYDLEIDTSEIRPAAVAKQIYQALQGGLQPAAFSILTKKYA